MMSGLAVLCLLLLQTGAHGFRLGGNSVTHQQITENAILNMTTQVCRALAMAEGKDFKFPPPPFTAESVALACETTKSSKTFHKTISLIREKNKMVDYYFFWSAKHHFDDETFTEGRDVIVKGLSSVKASIKQGKLAAGREQLGKILHTLQDFYSHSNWVEMKNEQPNSNLIRANTIIGNIDKNRPTCRNCDGDNCMNNILEDVLQDKILTTGYFSYFFPSKPKGKCSHGGKADQTSRIEPKGGINKDAFDSNHGYLHLQATKLAEAATTELLEDVRQAAGDKSFLRFLGITRGKPLCFVIDTTGSMMDDITEVKRVTSSLIDSKVVTEDEPSVYILVPFNDPEFGPLIRTTDPEAFKKSINSLTADGGGDAPEMSLSGLQLALTGAPSGSEIFLFTDAPAKDINLKSPVIALIEQTKSVVNFMITKVLGFRRRRQSDDNQQEEQQQYRMLRSDSQVYRDLADASGGQFIEVTKSELPKATSIITESSSASLVTLLQATRNAGNAENFPFTIDETVTSLTIYITGRSVSFTLISPSGVAQSSTNVSGPLIITSCSVGNFQTVQLNTQVGLWEIKMMSTNPYTLKVVGESPIDFLFDFLDVEGLTGGYYVIDSRPKAGVNGSMQVTITGSTSAVVREASLVESSGSGVVNGSVEAQGGGEFLVHFDRIPSVDFVVLVKGQSSNTSNILFQRQSNTNIRASTLTVTAADINSILVPGTPLSIPFTVSTTGAGGTFSIQVTNDRGFSPAFPSSLSLETGGRASGTVTITAPLNTTSGSDVTLTIQAEAPGGTDTNYALKRLTVLRTVTDFIPPVCQLHSLQSNCSSNCSLLTWELSVLVTDGANGTGVDRVSITQGNGTLNTSLAGGDNGTMLVSYVSTCCSPDVELGVVDHVGNVGTCFYTVRAGTTNSTQAPNTQAVGSLSTKAVQSFLLCISILILGLITSEAVIN
ncbi:von Willebrand factor A domain-containing protein 7-like isoform X2 [Mastacembelus armatus]|uniref:von Willebrand factor A domain-containing protein 7-like isoform X2 n=1 Tax=Mastacembelus armatus TaxID=205130 RepID=UPI000E462CED|nr:von Willebrand factor A domain-containing protein 7-like isoform X2 [Mastacembelus armatus]